MATFYYIAALVISGLSWSIASTAPFRGVFSILIYGTLVFAGWPLLRFIRDKLLIASVLILLSIVLPVLSHIALLLVLLWKLSNMFKTFKNISLLGIGLLNVIVISFLPSSLRNSFLLSWLDSFAPVVVSLLMFGLGAVVTHGILVILESVGHKRANACINIFGFAGVIMLLAFGSHIGPHTDSQYD